MFGIFLMSHALTVSAEMRALQSNNVLARMLELISIEEAFLGSCIYETACIVPKGVKVRERKPI